MIRIAPSLLAANFGMLRREVKVLGMAGADMLHCDIMDGSFVPAISFGHDIVANIGSSTDIPLDVHLMVSHPAEQVEYFAPLRPQVITFHLEAESDPVKLARRIRELGLLAGVAISPKTPATDLINMLSEIDLALIMTVEPGMGGQAFMPEMVTKINTVHKAIKLSGRDVMLEVDGGIGLSTIQYAAQAGADTFVAGTAIFAGEDGPEESIKRLRDQAIRSYI